MISPSQDFLQYVFFKLKVKVKQMINNFNDFLHHYQDFILQLINDFQNQTLWITVGSLNPTTLATYGMVVNGYQNCTFAFAQWLVQNFGSTTTEQLNLLATFQSALINLIAAIIAKLDCDFNYQRSTTQAVDVDCEHLLTFYHSALHKHNDYLLEPNEVLPADQQDIYLENKIALKGDCNDLFEKIKQRYQKLTIQEFQSKGG